MGEITMRKVLQVFTEESIDGSAYWPDRDAYIKFKSTTINMDTLKADRVIPVVNPLEFPQVTVVNNTAYFKTNHIYLLKFFDLVEGIDAIHIVENDEYLTFKMEGDKIVGRRSDGRLATQRSLRIAHSFHKMYVAGEFR